MIQQLLNFLKLCCLDCSCKWRNWIFRATNISENCAIYMVICVLIADGGYSLEFFGFVHWKEQLENYL